MNDSVTLRGCILMERGNTYDLHDYDKSAAAIELAVEWVNQNVFPANLTMQTIYVDIGSRCSGKPMVLSYAMDLWQRNITCNAYFGPGCGTAAEVLNDFAEYLGTPIFGMPAASVGIKAPFANYKLMIRASVSHTSMAYALIRFLTYFNYTTPYFFLDTFGTFYREMRVLVSATFLRRNPELYYGSKGKRFDSSITTYEDYRRYLRAVMAVSRVVFIMANASTVRQIMLAALDEGMTSGDYVFIAVEYFASDFWGRFTWRFDDDRDEDARTAFRTLLLLSIRSPVDSSLNTFWSNVKRRSRRENFYRFSANSVPDMMAVNSYDTIYLYASLVVTLLSRGQDFLNGSLIAATASNFTFFSVPQSRVSKLDENGDRILTYAFRNLDPNSGQFIDLYIIPSTFAGVFPLGVLYWPNGDTLPPNSPFCGFDGKAARCQAVQASTMPTIAGSVSVLVVLLILIPIGVCTYIQKTIAAKRDPYWWRIYRRELALVVDDGSIIADDYRAVGRDMGGTIGHRERSVTFTEPMEKSFSGKDDLAQLDAVARAYFALPVIYRSNPVGLADLPQPKHKASPRIIKSVKPLKTLHHTNLHNFIGIVLSDDNVCQYTVGELCHRRTLTSLLLAESFPLDQACKNSLIMDIVDVG
ncbi:atrial natriuretic peptide receptor 1-like [Paramacrobiotus metropolitanus]|uniref:atrial natriuretic peptide receptor 1-like n=1 Tax=Paramacrobiotus metropolitanus TaxID=2943436 RepID=UPI002445F410|nr:atrial natriuretic peptide receptor 1-like [Paramacrobiotus metropolitanus]